MSFSYDSLGNDIVRAQVRTYAGALQFQTERSEFDRSGRLTNFVTAAGGTIHFTYGALGEVTTVADAIGTVTRFAYDALGQPVEADYADESKANFSYDAEGRQTSQTDRDGHTTRFERIVVNVDGGNVERLVTVNPDGSVRAWNRILSGHAARFTDERGNTTTSHWTEHEAGH